MRPPPPSGASAVAAAPAAKRFVFGEFTVDVAARKLRRGDSAIALPSRALDALIYLIEHRDRLVQKNELIEAIWHDVVVTDDSLVHAVSVLRRVLADEPTHPKYIETVPRRGYRFIGGVRVEESGARAEEAAVPAPPALPHEPAPLAVSGPEHASGSVPPPNHSVPAPSTRRAPRMAWLAAAAGAAAIVAAFTAWEYRPPALESPEPRAVRLSQPPPPAATLASGGALSPDGRYLAFVARDDALGTARLWVRTLASNDLEPLAGTEGAAKPFWSPDSRRIGFFANGQLMTVDLATETARAVAAADVAAAGGTWGADDTIVFAVWANGLYAVPASGDGRVEPIAKLDRSAKDIAFAWPQFLPDGRRFIYQIVSLDPARSGVYVGDLDTRSSTRLLASDSAAVFAAPRHVLHVENGLLIAEEIDLARLELTGRASVVARGVDPPTLGPDNLISAAGGLLAFQHGATERNFAWYDRAGHRLGALALPTVLFNPRVSPDESRLVATSSLTHEPGLWLASLTRAEFERLATDAIGPLWSPDGSRVAFTARGGTELLVRSLEAGAPPQVVLADATIKILNDWSPDGADLLYTRVADEASVDLWIANVADGRARPLLTTPFNEMQARLSPDGRWIAYASDESGVLEVYVQRYPSLGEKRRVSVRGGGQPQWRADQRELFYLSADRALMSVEIDDTGNLELGAPRALFRPAVAGSPADARDHYAVTADGRKFLVDGAAQTGNDAAITVIVNWAAGAVEPPPTAANRTGSASRLLR